MSARLINDWAHILKSDLTYKDNKIPCFLPNCNRDHFLSDQHRDLKKNMLPTSSGGGSYLNFITVIDVLDSELLVCEMHVYDVHACMYMMYMHACI